MKNKILKDVFGRDYPREHVVKSCGPGWEKLIDKLIDDLFELGWDGSLHQVKEKFGGLRFYIGNGSDEIFNRIQQAEDESYKICIQCGAPGKVRTGGWLLSLCDEHAEGREEYDDKKGF